MGLAGILRLICCVEFWRMAVCWTISIVVSYVMLFTRNPKSFVRCSPRTSHFKPVCIVTGATSGLGEAAAHALAREGFYVILVGRSFHLLAKTMEGIKRKNENASLKAFEVDLSSFKSLLKFKDCLEQWLLDSKMHSSIQLLVNNAGILALSCRHTPEGHDQMMATNYISAFCLTKLLLPLLENSPVPARIVNVTSFTHRSVFNMQISKETVSGNCLLRSNQYPFAQVYEYTKLCLVLFSYELHRQLSLGDKPSNISVIAADPGVVETNIMRELPSSLSRIARTVLKLLGLLQSPEKGVSSILDAALAPPDTSGVYFFGGGGRTLSSSTLSYDTVIAKKLWVSSCDLLLEYQLASTDNSTSG